MEAHSKRLVIRIAAILIASGVFALAAALLRALKDPFWERHFLDNIALYGGSVLAAIPWFYLVDESPDKSWRGWVPAPLALMTGGAIFCVIFDLQRGRAWNSTILQMPEAMFWFVTVPAAVSLIFLVRERICVSGKQLSRGNDDVA